MDINFAFDLTKTPGRSKIHLHPASPQEAGLLKTVLLYGPIVTIEFGDTANPDDLFLVFKPAREGQ